MNIDRGQWWDRMWNPIVSMTKGPLGKGWHCTKVSPGCEHCWAETVNSRFGNGLPFVHDPEASFTVNPKRFQEPRGTRKPSVFFVQGMGDIFHEQVGDDNRTAILGTIEDIPRHVFCIVTKRIMEARRFSGLRWRCGPWGPFPPNAIAILTCCNQEEINRKVPDLLMLPAKTRALCLEPLLGPIALPPKWLRDIDWIIIGGESGAGARPMDPQWVDDIIFNAEIHQVPVFFKQWGRWSPGAVGGVSKNGMIHRAGWNGRTVHGKTYDGFPRVIENVIAGRRK
jgi:protein gp37